jgi:hypothetical protein
MSRHALEMVNLAHRYCQLIDASSAEYDNWLTEVAELLPRLHAAVNSLDGHRYAGEDILTPDLDARIELYSHLLELLGERDAYWLEFDQDGDSGAMTGSLADDLTDIYCELKHGLRSVDEHPEQAAERWVVGFECHWGRHLVDAERHLSALKSRGQLD